MSLEVAVCVLARNNRRESHEKPVLASSFQTPYNGQGSKSECGELRLYFVATMQLDEQATFSEAYYLKVSDSSRHLMWRRICSLQCRATPVVDERRLVHSTFILDRHRSECELDDGLL